MMMMEGNVRYHLTIRRMASFIKFLHCMVLQFSEPKYMEKTLGM